MTDQKFLKKYQVAGNGLLSRRLFLQNSLHLGTITSLALLNTPSVYSAENKDMNLAHPPWMKTPGQGFTPYGMPSIYEDQVVRYPTNNSVVAGNGVSWTPLHLLEGSITPNGLHYERHHNGVPQIDPAQHRLLIHGLTKQSLLFRMADLLRYPMYSKICFIECGGNSNAGWNKQASRADAGYFNGLISCSEWTGVRLSVLLDEAEILDGAKWIIAEGADAFAMQISIPLEKIYNDGFIALYQNGERIRPENGYPMRLIVPGWEGVLNVKWLRRIKLTNKPVMARNETSRYTELQASGNAHRFSFVMGVKSLITKPSANMFLDHTGFYEISGLAWSGHGKIKKVEVSADGGQTWALAALQEPILDCAWTRFRIPWYWNGSIATLKSRAIDEHNHVQPERSDLIAEHGHHSFFHYNAVVSWHVDRDGFVSHIYDSKDESIDNQADIDADWD